MPILQGLAAALAWLGRQGTRALAASIFFGLAVPQLAAYVKPHLGEAVFVLLLFSYLRIDPPALLRHVKSPVLAIAAGLWVMVAVPLLFGAVYAAPVCASLSPALHDHDPPARHCADHIVGGLCRDHGAGRRVHLADADRVQRAVADHDGRLQLSVSRHLAVFADRPRHQAVFLLCGLRRCRLRDPAHRGQRWIERQKDHIDGLNVIAVFVFAIVAMESVPRHVMADPLFAAACLGCSRSSAAC